MAVKFSPSTKGFYSPAVHQVIPNDVVDITDDVHQALLAGQAAGKSIQSDASGHPVLVDPPPPTIEQQIAIYTDEVQRHLDTFAATRGYNSLLSACSYATSTVARFAVEGQYCVTLRDQTWTQCYQILADYQQGLRPAPTLEELLAELPQPEWPQ